MTTSMQSSNRSPRINYVSWGRLEVEGEAEPYKDAKLFPGGSREWNWRETNTSHRPGIRKWSCFRVEWPSAFTFRARRSIF
jgi:hypothetical protein